MFKKAFIVMLILIAFVTALPARAQDEFECDIPDFINGVSDELGDIGEQSSEIASASDVAVFYVQMIALRREYEMTLVCDELEPLRRIFVIYVSNLQDFSFITYLGITDTANADTYKEMQDEINERSQEALDQVLVATERLTE